MGDVTRRMNPNLQPLHSKLQIIFGDHRYKPLRSTVLVARVAGGGSEIMSKIWSATYLASEETWYKPGGLLKIYDLFYATQRTYFSGFGPRDGCNSKTHHLTLLFCNYLPALCSSEPSRLWGTRKYTNWDNLWKFGVFESHSRRLGMAPPITTLSVHARFFCLGVGLVYFKADVLSLSFGG
jgi:hypothetical protein